MRPKRESKGTCVISTVAGMHEIHPHTVRVLGTNDDPFNPSLGFGLSQSRR
jgi:hypothetical protein